MLELVLAFVVVLVIVLVMSVGVIMGRKPIKGTCGGVGAALGEKNYTCGICGNDPNKCDDSSQQDVTAPASTLSYDATVASK